MFAGICVCVTAVMQKTYQSLVDLQLLSRQDFGDAAQLYELLLEQDFQWIQSLQSRNSSQLARQKIKKYETQTRQRVCAHCKRPPLALRDPDEAYMVQPGLQSTLGRRRNRGYLDKVGEFLAKLLMLLHSGIPLLYTGFNSNRVIEQNMRELYPYL
ncbi:hypothetical protein MP228_011247 [Amoeboaphelidium protococcarum]|nr:hypothetical protein MP228_011247 [Amoeboaphelidium protococcarum]